VQRAPARFTAARVCVAALVVLLVLGALLALGVSFASYSEVKHRLDSFASDHDANLTRERFRTVVWALRGAAVLLLLGAGAALLARRRAAAALSTLLVSSRPAASSLRAAARLPRIDAVALALIGAVAIAVRLDFLFQPMRYDEAGTYVHYASEPLYIGLSSYTAPNNHLFHTLLVHLVTSVLGSAPWAIRLPALLAGVLLVPATYLAGRAVYDGRVGLVAAALVAGSSKLIEYSTNARGYTLLALVFMLDLALAVVLARDDEPAAWAAFAVLGAIGMWTVPTMAYALVVLVLWLVATILLERTHLSLLRSRLLPALLATGAITLLLYLPPLVSSGPHALLRNDFVKPRGFAGTARHLPRSLWETLASWNRDVPVAVAVVLALGFAVALAAQPQISRFRIPPAAAGFVVVPLALAQRVVPFDRVWLFLLPLYLLTATAGLVLVVGRRATRGATAVVAVLVCALLCGGAVASQAVAHSEDTSTFRDAPHVASFLERTLRPGDRVLVSPPADLILEYYLDRAGLDSGRLLYTEFAAKRVFVVVKEGPRDYPLHVVIEQHLSASESRGLRAMLVKRYAHTGIYRLSR
jgi:hypothetical protein